jgi:hypothetical protein
MQCWEGRSVSLLGREKVLSRLTDGRSRIHALDQFQSSFGLFPNGRLWAYLAP